MRTTLDINAKLLDGVVEATGEKSKSKAVSRVLEEFIRGIKIDELRAMAGKVQIDDQREEQRAADLERERFLDKLRGG